MQNRHVVDKPDIASLHAGPNLVLACYEMDGIEGFGLRFSEPGDTFGACPCGCVSDQETPREFEDYFPGRFEDCGTFVERRVAAVASLDIVSLFLVRGEEGEDKENRIELYGTYVSNGQSALARV